MGFKISAEDLHRLQNAKDGEIVIGNGVNLEFIERATVAKGVLDVKTEVVADMLKGASEKEFQAFLIGYAQKKGWRVAHFRKVLVTVGKKTHYETPAAADGAGWPDLVLCRPPEILFVELKVKKNPLTFEQDKWISDIGKCGMSVHIWRPEDWEVIAQLLD